MPAHGAGHIIKMHIVKAKTDVYFDRATFEVHFAISKYVCELSIQLTAIVKSNANLGGNEVINLERNLAANFDKYEPH